MEEARMSSTLEYGSVAGGSWQQPSPTAILENSVLGRPRFPSDEHTRNDPNRVQNVSSVTTKNLATQAFPTHASFNHTQLMGAASSKGEFRFSVQCFVISIPSPLRAGALRSTASK